MRICPTITSHALSSFCTMPHVTLVVVTHVTPRLVHMSCQHPYAQSTCQLCLPRVASKSFHIRCMKSATYVPIVLPCQLYGHTTYTVSCHVALYELYSQHFFLPIWRNKQNVISGAYDVCLSLFKLCWVCINKAYTHIRFEANMRTLIFRAF
jgi:hypothetical protein